MEKVFKRAAAAAVLSASIAVPGLVEFSTAVASARPISESTIKSECKSVGGTYYTFTNQFQYSTCTYTAGGAKYRDYYVDGEYYHTAKF